MLGADQTGFLPTAVWVATYQREGRAGALLKMSFGRKSMGHADLCPWPEFGDPPLKDVFIQLRAIKTGALSLCEISPLLHQTLRIAEMESCFIEEGESAYVQNGLPQIYDFYPKSYPHFQWGEFAQFVESKGKTTELFIKMKIKAEETQFLIFLLKASEKWPSIRWHLDFNSSLSRSQAQDFMRGLRDTGGNFGSSLLSRVEVIEDLFSLSGNSVSVGQDLQLLEEFRHVLFWDWEIRNLLRLQSPPEVGGLVMKPSHWDPTFLLEKIQCRRLLFTQSLSHTLGYASSLALASRFLSSNSKRDIEVMRSGFAPTGGELNWQSSFERVGDRILPKEHVTLQGGWGMQKLLSEVAWDPL